MIHFKYGKGEDGAVATNMGVDRETGFGKTVTGMLRPLFQTRAEGAETAVLLYSPFRD